MPATTASPTIYGPNGSPLYVKPEPNELVEERVRAELKKLDSLLDIRWFPTAVYNKRRDTFEGRYGLIVRWPQTDRRWKLYRKGEIGEPFDLLGWFCEDVQDANSVPLDPDAVWRRTRELLAKCDNTRQSWRARMRYAVENNKKVREDRAEQVREAARQAAEIQYYAGGQGARAYVPDQIEQSAEKN